MTWRSRVSTNLQNQLQLVHDEKIDFGEFVARTRREFHAMAMHLARRWTPPEWFTISDLEQELYLGAWKYVWRYDASKGTTLSRFVVYNAMTSAKTQLHKARGVTISGSPDRKLSTFEIPLSAFGEEGEGDLMLASLFSDEDKAEEKLIDNQHRKESVAKILKACETKQERYTVLAIREAGSLDAASRLLYDDMDHRIALRLVSEEHASRFVMRHAYAVAARVIDDVEPV